jgi:hypothetical protein
MKTKTKIYITTNFCGCRLCKGSRKVETSLDREAFKAARNGHIVRRVGGRNPRLYISYGEGK